VICEKCSKIQCFPWLLLDRCAEVANILCGKPGAVQRSLCGGCHGGFIVYRRLLQ